MKKKYFKITLVAVKVRDIVLLMTAEVIATSKRHQRTEKTLYNVDYQGQADKCKCQNPVKENNDRK